MEGKVFSNKSESGGAAMKKWISLSSCLLVAALITILWVGTAFAEVEKLTLEELTNRASTIVRGGVVGLKSHWDEDHAVIYTSVTISITDYLKGGTGAKELTIEVPGGIVGEIGLTVSDVPRFEADQEVILFLEEHFQVVGWFQGKYTIVDNIVAEKGIPVNQFIGQIHAIMERSGIPIEPTPAPEKGLTKPTMEFGHERLDLATQKPTIGIIEETKPKAPGEIALPEAAAGWTNIMTEGFEGAFPGSTWTLYGDPTWDDTSYRAHSGSWSGYCADGGSNRVNPPGPYPNNMNAWMVYGPFSLSDATDAELLFYHWTKTELTYDYLFFGASINGSDFYGTRKSGDWVSSCGGWCEENFDLTNVYTLGDLRGKPQVWIGFKFGSDSSVTYEGTYLDDITLRKETAGAIPHINSISPDHGPAHANELGSCGCAADSTRVTISGSNFGATQGSSYVRFWRQGSTYYNACVESWSDTQIVARVPGCVSSGDVVVVTGGGTSNGVYFTVTYSYGGGKWPKGSYPQPMSEEYRVNASGGPSGALAAIQAAANTWNNVSCADFFFRYGGTSSKTGYGYDNENTILWQDLPTGILGVNVTWWNTSDPHTIIEFDIAFNTDYTWATDCSAGKYDVQSIGTHELGHALQLLDLYGTADTEKTMYGIGSAGDCKQRTLEPDDIAGICYIYPGVAQPFTWYFAEGYTGGTFDTYILLMNPNSSPANVTVTFMKPDGSTKSVNPTIGANSRYTIKVDDVAGMGDTGFGTKVTSDICIVAERAMYWSNYSGGSGGHNTMGTTPLGCE